MATFVAVAMIGGLAVSNAFATSSSKFVTRTGNQLVLDGSSFRFAGTNMYWLGLDDNIRDSAGNPTYPTNARVDNGFAAAKSMGATVVRSHTLGISVGNPESIEPSKGVFNDAAFKSIDYAVADAGKNGIKLQIPLTDQWRWYHGGKSVFTGWEGYANDPNTSVNSGNSQTQKASEANFYTDPKVIADFEAYISHLMNHVNQYTGVAMKDDPTILDWETGNEIWDAPPSWTETIAKFIKSNVGAQQLVMDGDSANGNTVSNAAINEPDVDIVGGHFYPMDTNWMTNDAAIAAAHNKVYLVGEYDWTNLGQLSTMLSAVESNKNIAGDLTWVTLPYEENGTPEPHGDSENLYVPATNSNMASGEAMLTVHAKVMNAGSAVIAPVTTTTAKPTTTTTAKPIVTTTTIPQTSPTTAKPIQTTTTTTAKPVVTVPPVATPAGNATVINDNVVGYNLNQINYVGNWNTGNGSGKFDGDDHYSDNANASFSVNFNGTSVTLYGANAPWHGLAAVSIDGKFVKNVDYYSANRADNVAIFSQANLASGSHKLSVQVLGKNNGSSSGNVVTVDRVVTTNVASSTPPTTQAPQPVGTVAAIINDSVSGSGLNQINYIGPWNTGNGSGKYNGDDHYSDNSTSSFSVKFTGTSVKIYGANAPWHGLASISIDGGTAKTVDYYSANRADNVLIFASPTLAAGQHTIVVKVLDAHDAASSDNVVTVDRVVIS